MWRLFAGCGCCCCGGGKALGAHQQVADDALGQLQRPLDFNRRGGRQLEPTQDVEAVAETANRVGQSFAAPGIDVFNRTAALGDQRLDTGIHGFNRSFVKVRVEHDHQFVVSHRSSFLWVSSSPRSGSRKDRQEYSYFALVLIRVMGGLRPPWGQSLLRSYLASPRLWSPPSSPKPWPSPCRTARTPPHWATFHSAGRETQ